MTAGQAFGGDLEAVTVHTALLAARLVVGADLVVVAQGPGNLGTGTRWGFSGVAAGEAVNAAGTLGGRPVGSLRVSGADDRPRHRGVSHHSLTALGRVALLPADVVVPVFPPGPMEGLADDDGVPPLEAGTLAGLGARVHAQALALVEPVGRHRLVEVDAGSGPARRARGVAGPAVDHGPRARRGPGGVPGRGRGRRARGGPARLSPARRPLARPVLGRRRGALSRRGGCGCGWPPAPPGAGTRRRRGRRRTAGRP